jgi:hypothetical protein
LASLPVAAADESNTTLFGKRAIDGYDPVTYFDSNRAVEGDSDFEVEWMDAKWRFSSAANRDKFNTDPARYAPQYGGYCAYAVSQNSTAGIDPEQFTVLDGKLYLNYSAKIQKKWLADRDAYIVLADKNWPGVVE